MSDDQARALGFVRHPDNGRFMAVFGCFAATEKEIGRDAWERWMALNGYRNQRLGESE